MGGIPASALITTATSLRLLLAPVVMALVFAGEDAEIVAAVVFAAAAVTDILDGYLARRWEITTALGAFLDTTADKLLVSFALIALLAEGRASPWVVAIIIGRELLILGLRSAVAVGGAVMETSSWGKRKTAIQFLAVLIAIVRPGEEIAGLYADQYVMLAAAAITAASAVDYIARFRSALKEG